jgi:hypothetical protein
VSDDEIRDQVLAAIKAGDAIVCYTKCWPCNFGDHYDPPQWHTWADSEDVEHAQNTGQPDPRTSRCGCDCADAKETK